MAVRHAVATVTAPDDTPLAKRLEAAIEQSSLSQHALARKLAGRSASQSKIDSERRQVSRYLAGTTIPGKDRARALEKALGVPAGSLTIQPEKVLRLPDQLARIADELEVLRRDRKAIERRLRELAEAVDSIAQRLDEGEQGVRRRGSRR